MIALLVAGCASPSKGIAPSYVSPLTYKHLTCQDIEVEVHRVIDRAVEVAEMVDARASEDDFKMAMGMIVFLPPLFFIEGNGPEATEYAALQGQYEALKEISLQKQCDIEIISPTRFDGEWVLTVDDVPAGAVRNPVRMRILNHRFSSPFDTGAYVGDIEGGVDEKGEMLANFSVAPKDNQSSVFHTSLTADHANGQFSSVVGGWVWTHWKEFRVTISKAAP
jgi:hypothetical protein